MLPETEQLQSLTIDLGSGSYTPAASNATNRRNPSSSEISTRPTSGRRDDELDEEKKVTFIGRQSKKFSMLWADRNSRALLVYTTLSALLAIMSILYGSITSSIGSRNKYCFPLQLMWLYTNRLFQRWMWMESKYYSTRCRWPYYWTRWLCRACINPQLCIPMGT